LELNSFATTQLRHNLLRRKRGEQQKGQRLVDKSWDKLYLRN